MINVIDEDGTILQFSIQIGSASQLLAELKTEQSTLTFSVFPLQHSGMCPIIQGWSWSKIRGRVSMDAAGKIAPPCFLGYQILHT